MSLAMSEALPLAQAVSVGVVSCDLLNINDKWSHVRLPTPVTTFIWDVGQTPVELRYKIAERDFVIDVPDEFCPKEPVRPAYQEVQQCVTS